MESRSDRDPLQPESSALAETVDRVLTESQAQLVKARAERRRSKRIRNEIRQTDPPPRRDRT
jgi:hypothetical protein